MKTILRIVTPGNPKRQRGTKAIIRSLSAQGIALTEPRSHGADGAAQMSERARVELGAVLGSSSYVANGEGAGVPERERLIWNTLSGYLKQGVACIAVFLFTPYFIQQVGAAHYGLWTFLLSMLGFFELLDCGFSTAIVKYCAHHGATEESEDRNRIISTVMVFYLLISLVCTLATAVISQFCLPVWIAEVDLALARLVLWVLALRVIILAMPFSVFRGVIIGNQDNYLYNIVNSVMYTIYVSLACWMLYSGGGVLSVAIANLVAMVFEWSALTIAAFWRVRSLRISPRLIDWSSLRPVASFSVAQAIANLTSVVHLRADPLIIKSFLSLSSVATYGIGLRVATFAVQFIKQLSNALSPAIAACHGAGKAESVREMLIQGSKYSLGVALVICMPMCLLPDLVIRAWIGEGYDGAAGVMGLLGLSLIASAPTMIGANVLAMAGRERRMMLYSIVGLSLNVSLSVALIRPLGIAGVALATLITDVFVGLILAVGDACRGLGTSRWEYYGRVAWPLIPAVVLQAAVLVAARWLLPLDALWMIAAVSGLAGSVFVVTWHVTDPESPPVPERLVVAGRRLVARLPFAGAQAGKPGNR